MAEGVICSNVMPLACATWFSSSTMPAMSVWSGMALVRRKTSAIRICDPCLAWRVNARAEVMASFVSAICLPMSAAFERCGPITRK